MKIEIQNKKTFLRKIKSIFVNSDKIAQQEIKEAVNEIYNRSQMAVPSNVVRGINLRATAYKEVRKLSGEVGYNSVVAPYYEFGTGAYVDIPSGLEEYAAQFYINGLGRIEPHPFLFPAFYQTGLMFGQDTMKAISNIWYK